MKLDLRAWDTLARADSGLKLMEGEDNNVQHHGSISGLYYFDDFVTAEEEAQIVKLIDSSPFSLVCIIVRAPTCVSARWHRGVRSSDRHPTLQAGDLLQAIHRKQQFWGELYYHTTHDVVAVQPNQDMCTPPGHQLDFLPMRWLVDRFMNKSPYSSYPLFRRSRSMPNQCLVNEYVANQVLLHLLPRRSFSYFRLSESSWLSFFDSCVWALMCTAQ